MGEFGFEVDSETIRGFDDIFVDSRQKSASEKLYKMSDTFWRFLDAMTSLKLT